MRRIALRLAAALVVASPVARGVRAQVSPATVRPIPAERAGYAAVAGGRVYYAECGTPPARAPVGTSREETPPAGAPVLVLLHDGVLGAATWDAVWPALCARFRVVRYDRRGKGRSPAATAPFSPVADLEALLADRGLARATLVGSSAGGALALDYTLAHPERVERLVLLGPVVGGLPFSEHFAARERANAAPLVARGDVAGTAARLAADPYLVAPGDAPGSMAARRAIRDYFRANPQDLRNALAAGRFETPPAVPAVARLGGVRAPTLILVGAADIPDVHAHAGAIEFGVWGARREVVPGAGHMLALERPAWLGERVAAFVAEAPVAAVPADRLAALAGTYAPFVRGAPGTVAVSDGRLVLRLAGERELPLFAADDSTLYTPFGPGVRVAIHRGPDGAPASADVTIGGATHRAAAARPPR